MSARASAASFSRAPSPIWSFGGLAPEKSPTTVCVYALRSDSHKEKPHVPVPYALIPLNETSPNGRPHLRDQSFAGGVEAGGRWSWQGGRKIDGCPCIVGVNKVCSRWPEFRSTLVGGGGRCEDHGCRWRGGRGCGFGRPPPTVRSTLSVDPPNGGSAGDRSAFALTGPALPLEARC